MATRSPKPPASKPVTVTLGGMAKSAQAHVASGRYASISEVVRAGLRALDREEEALHELLRARVAKIRAHPETTIPMDEAFKRLREHAALSREAAEMAKGDG
jgi:antitoxin ParD1/3/4